MILQLNERLKIKHKVATENCHERNMEDAYYSVNVRM